MAMMSPDLLSAEPSQANLEGSSELETLEEGGEGSLDQNGTEAEYSAGAAGLPPLQEESSRCESPQHAGCPVIRGRGRGRSVKHANCATCSCFHCPRAQDFPG